MGVLIPEGFGQATFLFAVSGSTRPQNFTLGYKPVVAGTSVIVNASTLRTVWSAAGRPFIGTNMTTAWTFLGVKVVETAGGLPVVGEDLTATVGSVATETFPPNCALLVRKNTSRGGRTGRGRCFVPAAIIGETSANSAGVISSGALVAYQNQFTAAFNAQTAALLPGYLLHSSGLIAPTLINTLTVLSPIATQRRRIRK